MGIYLNQLTHILNEGDVADGHRSRQRAEDLLPEFKQALGLGVEDQKPLNPAMVEFITEVVLGAAWYQKHVSRGKIWLGWYIFLNCAVIIGLPVGLAGLGVWAKNHTGSDPTVIAGQIAGILTGILALQKTLSGWYSSQQRYAIWYKSSSDLKTVYYTFIQTWYQQVPANIAGFRAALSAASAAARQLIYNEQLTYYQSLALPSFDILDMLTSTKSTVSGLVTSFLPGTAPAAVSVIGRNSFLVPAPNTDVSVAAPTQVTAHGAPQANQDRPMFFSKHSLHHRAILSTEHKTMVEEKVASIIRQRALIRPTVAPAPGTQIIPLTTVSLNTDFDAYINIFFTGSNASSPVSLLVDSGNSTLIVPHWEDIASLPNTVANYTVLGAGKEPWGCPANIVRGPINIATSSGGTYTTQNCVFYACTGNGPDGSRTANFGVSCISPWTASGWNTPPGINVIMQAPLSYDPGYPFAEFNYQPAGKIFGPGGTPNVSGGSSLTLYQTEPAGYTTFKIIPNLQWMALIPKTLAIGGQTTSWPGSMVSPIAMIDTGGGPVYLNDPNGYVFSTSWPDQVANPGWTSTSSSCQSTSDSIAIELCDATNSISYVIDPSSFPPAAQGLTLVMCQNNAYMMQQNGMNIGGISALVNLILIDYGNCRVGLQPG